MWENIAEINGEIKRRVGIMMLLVVMAVGQNKLNFSMTTTNKQRDMRNGEKWRQEEEGQKGKEKNS